MIRLSAALVELIHDELVTQIFRGIEPVFSGQLIRKAQLESALAHPFAGLFDQEFYPTFAEKAARLFHGLAAGHAFLNGNKRTAVVALDLFCYANEMYLTLENASLYPLALLAASHNELGIPVDSACSQIANAFSGSNLIPFDALTAGLRSTCEPIRDFVRFHRLNR